MTALILFAPFAGFLISGILCLARAGGGLSPRSSDRLAFKISGGAASAACLISFFAAAAAFAGHLAGRPAEGLALFPWISAGDLSLSLSFSLDPLSLIMALLITGAGSLIHIYSLSYMAGAKGAVRYFAYLNLFVFMMLVLVLAGSLPVLFAGWEGVGLCSYLLIGFWFEDSKKAGAGMTAFLVNRIGDACFLLGMFVLFFHAGSLDILEINSFAAGHPELAEGGLFSPLSLAGLLLFLGAAGKSAQIPLYFWLPEAMAGPTPVSALIHAATMVTAGVYMMVRLSGLYNLLPELLSLAGWIGAWTALGAALLASRQWDLKKVLAYSTVSQLAYMFMALSAGAFSAGIFHLLTHGFFKALLFLCAGALIHGLSGEQDIRRMGGLRRRLPKIFLLYMAGALALVALPPFAGFFSKDEILWSLFASGRYGLWAMAFAAALATAFYMGRLTALVFFGKERFKGPAPRRAPALMWIPMGVLALLSLFGGLLGWPHLLSEILPGHFPHFLHAFLRDISPAAFEGPLKTEALLMILSPAAAAAVFLSALFAFKKPGAAESGPAFWKTALERELFVREFLKRRFLPGFFRFSEGCFKGIDIALLQGGILFLSRQIFSARQGFALWQNGNFQSYGLFFALGAAGALILIFIW